MNTAEQEHYINLIRESSLLMESLPVKLPPEWEKLLVKKGQPVLKGIRAVLFDLYGTLFISGAGEISVTDTIDHTKAQRHKGKNSVADKTIQEMKEYFTLAVKHFHEKAKAAGIACPEVRAEEIWAGYKGKIPDDWELPQKMRHIPGKTGPEACCAGQELALRFELECNSVYPMPHAEETLRSLIRNNVKLGIISNAQFFTPLLFNAFFNVSPADLGFDPELLIYSFEEGEAKPSPRLFSKAMEHLAGQNIKPQETLFIGNDMKNDIIPAAKAGFTTALFAGDRRSLRLREDDPACTGKKPDMVIDDLQVLVRDSFNTDNKDNVYKGFL